MNKRTLTAIGCFVAFLLTLGSASVRAQDLVGEGPRLGPLAKRITQADIESDHFSLQELRKAGLKIFTTPFNTTDGMGDGPMNPLDPTSPGGRPTLQNNGTTLRVNGLDAQTCLECHAVVSNATVPATLGVGGSGTAATSAMFMPTSIDVGESAGNGFAAYDGRLIVPPHLFGVGGAQLLAKEMTAELQQLKQQALANPNNVVSLDTKGVHFGTIVADTNGNIDTSNVEGIDPDLVVRFAGRKGEFSSVRQFDQGAMMFHFGMQPVEIVGEDVDDDHDGVMNEILIGELSVLEIFLATQDRPRQDPLDADAQQGRELFAEVGCADCHRPMMTTHSRFLPFSFPDVSDDPFANVYYEVDLSKWPTRFEKTPDDGLKIRLFSDLKRHYMGQELMEDFQGATSQQNGEFITVKLWGVADSAPYLHDGRAQTIGTAIKLHGGEAQTARDNFVALSADDKNAVLKYLRTLRTPSQPNRDVVPNVSSRLGGPLDHLSRGARRRHGQ